MHSPQGLAESEVLARRARGLGHEARLQTSRSTLQILRQNAFTFINSILFAIGLVLVVLGRPGDALVTAGLVLMNVVVGVVQEGRAKRTLDRIALLTRPKATVIRTGRDLLPSPHHIEELRGEGSKRRVDPSELVLGDLLLVGPGDQIVVDGQVVGDERMEVDESLLTGESDLVSKSAGDPVYSGSFCVTGSAFYEAQHVGTESLAQRITASARAFRQIKTPLQRDIDLVIRALVLVVAPLGGLLAISSIIGKIPLVQSMQIAAVIVSLVPQGLFFMTTVTYAMGAMRIAGKGALIQQANAVESLSHVQVLCLDKTGTLTTNRLRLHALEPLGSSESELRCLLGAYAASTPTGNRTLEAIGAAYPGQAQRVREQVPFSSERKWSAIMYDDETPCEEVGRGSYVLGASDVLRPHVQAHAGLDAQEQAWAAQGLRVLLFAHGPESSSLHDREGQPQLPSNLIALGILSLSDELRPDAQTTIQGLARAGIRLKIISGDNPQTVAALARQAGFGLDAQTVSGLELNALDEAGLAQVAEETAIFGRITPQQKDQLIQVLRSRGHYVAMIGDGVNDVLSLKQAQLGIAMQSGSQAARSVADIILLNDSFAVLPDVFREGQRIIRGMQDIVRLFLTRTFYVTLLIIAARIVGLPFPVTPKHNSLLALLTVGIPVLALASWARPGPPPKSLLRSVAHFVVPGAISMAILSLAVYLYYLLTSDNVALAQSAMTTTMVFCGLVLLPFVEPPTAAWVGGDELSGDRRPIMLALGLLVLYGIIMLSPALTGFFELQPLPWLDLAGIALLAALWALALRFIWRRKLFERSDPLT